MGTATYRFVDSLEQEAKALARGLRSRDPDLLDRLIEQYQYRLFRYLFYLMGSRETAEDLFQETWIRVLERGHLYDGKSKFETWLFSIARHLAIDVLRRQKTPVGLAQSLDDLSGPHNLEATSKFASRDTASPTDLLSKREESERIQAALGLLPAAHREVLVLRFQEDLELAEIATVVAAPLSTVKSRLYRGLEALRVALAGDQL
jgi:RNA polymerase sigma-70 factor (ECF subfamily)